MWEPDPTAGLRRKIAADRTIDMLWNNTESDLKGMEGTEAHGYNYDGWHVDCLARDNIPKQMRRGSVRKVIR